MCNARAQFNAGPAGAAGVNCARALRTEGLGTRLELRLIIIHNQQSYKIISIDFLLLPYLQEYI